MLGACVDASAGISDCAKRILDAVDEGELVGIRVVAGEGTDGGVHCTLRARFTDQGRCDEGALLAAHEAVSIPEAEATNVAVAAGLIVEIDAAPADASHVHEEAHGIGAANLGVQIAAVRLADLDGRVPHGVVERIVLAIGHGGVADFGNGDALKNAVEGAENAATVGLAFIGNGGAH